MNDNNCLAALIRWGSDADIIAFLVERFWPLFQRRDICVWFSLSQSTLNPSDHPTRERKPSFRARFSSDFSSSRGVICLLSYPTPKADHSPSPWPTAHLSEGQQGCATFERRHEVIEAIEVFVRKEYIYFPPEVLSYFTRWDGTRRTDPWILTDLFFSACTSPLSNGKDCPRLGYKDNSGPPTTQPPFYWVLTLPTIGEFLMSPIRVFPGAQMTQKTLWRHSVGLITTGRGRSRPI